MGHIRLGPIPATKRWHQVIELVACGADAPQLANATIRAAEQGLRTAAQDPAVLEALWLLARIPIAARTPDFARSLRRCGLDVEDRPTLFAVSVAYSTAVDALIFGGRHRTDLGEMAQMAGVETINAIAAPRASTLWGTGPEETVEAFASLATPTQFGRLARSFFTRFSFKCLNYFLSKILPQHVGDGERFQTVTQQARFTDALERHCREATFILEEFAEDWFSRHKLDTAGDITRTETQGFLSYAVETKLNGEFRRREARRAN